MVGKLYAIVATRSKDRGIGIKGDLLYPFKEDLKHFKNCTMGERKEGHSLIMGRKTFESLPRILPGRHHFVVSSKPKENNQYVTWCTSLSHAVQKSQQFTDKDTYIIGGSSLYNDMWSFQPNIILTSIIDTRAQHHQPIADTFFPELPKEYQCVEESGWRRSMTKQYITYNIETFSSNP